MTKARPLEQRPEPGKWASIGLSALTHAALVLLLIYGIRWQSRAPEAVEVELYRALPAPAPVQPVEKPAPPPEPKVEPKPEPRPEPKPEPKVEPKPPPKPDIALKEEKKPKPKEEPKPKPPPKEEPKPKVDENLQRRLLQEQMERELQRESQRLAQQRLTQQAAQETAQMREQQAATAAARGQATWIDKIRSKIRGNLVKPDNLVGNPEAVFDVAQLPSGEVLSVKLRKSSGNPALDAAIERAILKSSPLPKPENSAMFVRDLHLTFKPNEE